MHDKSSVKFTIVEKVLARNSKDLNNLPGFLG